MLVPLAGRLSGPAFAGVRQARSDPSASELTAVEPSRFDAPSAPLVLVEPVDHSRWTDGQLIQAVATGSGGALEEVYRRYNRSMHVVAVAMRGESAADDLVHDVFLRIWHRPHLFDPARGALGSFLRMQTRSRAIDLIRSDTARRAREDREPADRSACSTPTEEAALAHIDAHHTWAMLERLPQGERDAIALAFLGSHTYREVAAMLDQPEGTIKGRIRSGLRRLRTTELGPEATPGPTP